MFSKLATVAMLGAGASAVQVTNDAYKGQQVFQCKAAGIDMEASFDKLVQEHELDVWGQSREGTVDVRVETPLAADAVRKFFKGQCKVAIEDLQVYVDDFDNEQAMAKLKGNNFFDSYHTLEENEAWWRELESANPDIVQLNRSIGQSFEGRNIFSVRISADARKKPSFFLQCQVHAREWITGATCAYITEQLVAAYRAGDELARRVFEETELHVVPFVNPDGYVHSMTPGGRLWRKTRNTNTGSTCLGTDMNRNFNDHWGEGGSSANPCSDTYRGRTPASEPETIASQEYFRSIGPVIGAWDTHSYSQLILRPYGWTRNQAPDETKLRAIGDDMTAAIRAKNGRTYRSIRSIDLYLTTGSCGDWLYGEDATSTNQGYRAIAYTMELRPAGANPGFQLPPREIIPTGEENYEGFRAFLQGVLADPIRL